MAKVLSLFNHKGGVSKTTTAFNLGWKLADKGRKVLLVDCDPQCNLTGMVLGFTQHSDLEDYYAQSGVRDLRDALAPAFESRPTPLTPGVCERISAQPNLSLLAGHIGIAEYEVTLGIAQELSSSLMTLKNLPGAIHHVLQLTAAQQGADLIIVDLSPSLGALNQNLVSISDFIIVPMNPDYFSVLAIDSLSKVLPRWAAWGRSAALNPTLQNATYPFPAKTPKVLGTIIQKFRPRSGGDPAQAFQKWINKLNDRIGNTLAPAIGKSEMLLTTAEYQSAGLGADLNLIQMADFNSLIAKSQDHSVPIFNLTDEQLNLGGVLLERTKESMKSFDTLFETLADRVLKLMKI